MSRVFDEKCKKIAKFLLLFSGSVVKWGYFEIDFFILFLLFYTKSKKLLNKEVK